jgi:hypothetical protein
MSHISLLTGRNIYTEIIIIVWAYKGAKVTQDQTYLGVGQGMESLMREEQEQLGMK